MAAEPRKSLLLDEIAVAAARLAEAGVDSPRADAEQIAAQVHGVGRGELHRVPDSGFNPRFWDEIARREAREPLQHITGHAYFRYLDLEVGPGVFVPRPETEVMTGWAIDRLREMDVTEPVVTDLGTGSGAIALAIAQETGDRRSEGSWLGAIGNSYADLGQAEFLKAFARASRVDSSRQRDLSDITRLKQNNDIMRQRLLTAIAERDHYLAALKKHGIDAGPAPAPPAPAAAPAPEATSATEAAPGPGSIAVPSPESVPAPSGPGDSGGHDAGTGHQGS